MLYHYLKIAFRNMWKYKVQNSIGILGVTLGLVCFALCCYIPRFLSGWDKSYPDSDRMYFLKYSGDNPSINLHKELRSRFPSEIEKTTFVTPSRRNIMLFESEDGKNIEYEIRLLECDTSMLSFYSLKTVRGTYDEIKHSVNSIVLFESFAKTLGISENLIGKPVFLQEKWFHITGIIKDLPKNSSLTINNSNGFIFNVIDGFLQKAEVDPIRYDIDMLPSLIMLKKGIRADQFQAKLNAELHFDDGKREPYQIGRYNHPFEQENRKVQMSVIVIIGILIFATGLFNYISFLMAQCYNRLGNYAIRKVNGSGRNHLFGLIFTEFLLVWLLAGVLSFRIPDLFASFFDLLRINYVYFESHVIHRQVIEYILAGIPCIALICIILATSIEKLSIRTIELGVVTKGNRMIVRNILLLIQMFIFIGFASAIILVYLQTKQSSRSVFSTFTSKEKENTFIIDCSSQKSLMDNKELLLHTIQSSPFVQKATYAFDNFYQSYSSKINIQPDRMENDFFPYAVRNYVSPEFPDFFKVKVLAGKFMDFESAPDRVVIDENFASLYKGENPIGKSFLADNEKYTIMGIVQNVQYYKGLDNSNLIKSKNPPVYYISDVSPWNNYYIYVIPIHGKSKDLKQQLEKYVREFLPSTIHFNIVTLAELIEKNEFYNEIVFLKTSSLFGGIALAICLLSLYSSITMNTEHRRKEVAIRKINGAGVWEIIRLFSKTYLSILTIACLLVFPVVYFWGNRWLEQYSQRIFLTPFFFLLIFLGVSGLIFFTILLIIKKVADQNPAEVVKGE